MAKATKGLLFLAFILVLGQAMSVQAAGLLVVDETYWRDPGVPGPFVPPPRPRPTPIPHAPRYYAPLEVKQLQVRAHIRDQVAETTIKQEFYNPNSTRLEGTFLFPIPKGAHLDKFSMEIDGKQVEAELLTAAKARGIYEDIVRKARDPALLEYACQDVLKARIFPIEPRSSRKITLRYTQVLQADAGLLSYTVPLDAEKYSAKPVGSLAVEVELESKRPLKSVYSSSHKAEVRRHGAFKATVGFESADKALTEDFVLYFAPEKDDVGVNLLTHRVEGEDGYFLLLASPGVITDSKRVLPKDVVFVLDTSGSMAGNKLEQAKKALAFCVENLNETDRFQIIRFSTEVESLFDGLAEASSDNRAKAEAFVKQLKPIGGTAIDAALKEALKTAASDQTDDRVFLVVFLTDGRPTVGITDEAQILENVKRANDHRTRVFCFGLGTDVNTHLLDKITERTRAFSQYVLPEEDIEVKVSSFFSRIKEPVLANPTLKFTGGLRVSKLYPSPLPDLFSGDQWVLVGRFSGSGDSAAMLEGTVNGQQKRLAFDLQFPAECSDNEFIPRLWATRRIGYLLDEIRLHGENSELRDEVTELARKHGVVTPYTAYLIVEDEARRDVPVRLRSMQSFDQDRATLSQAASAWNEFQTQRSGEAAVADASFGTELKAANAPAPIASEGRLRFMRRYGLMPGGASSAPAPAASTPSTVERLVQYSQQTQFAGGRNFFLNGNQWTDSNVQNFPKAPYVRLEFGSAEYFRFAEENPKALPWLALGQNVQFVLNNTVYEVYVK